MKYFPSFKIRIFSVDKNLFLELLRFNRYVAKLSIKTTSDNYRRYHSRKVKRRINKLVGRLT